MITTPQPSRIRFFAMMLMGMGFISVGVVLFFLMKNTPPTTAVQDFSAVPAKVDFAAPELVLEDLAGNTVSLREHLGSVVLVNLWATWCPPCKDEMPTLQAFYEKYKKDGFVLIAIDQEETRDVVEPFVEEFGMTFPIWLDMDWQAQREFNTSSLPSSYVIDRSGRVRLMWIGGISKKNLEKYVPDLITE
ncbi:MAG: TlpA family protein disulfide reductase [Chloroflexi bacterium]|nr:TlpA family protein disulfide reductase [Chloroflexota bacterium]